MWFYSKLGNAGDITLREREAQALELFPRYFFQAIRYWPDEDIGHGEEVRKRSASSIGTVVAGRQGLLALVVCA